MYPRGLVSGARLLLLPALTLCAWGAENRLRIYPVADGMARGAGFAVKVRTAGQEWQDVPVYVVKVARGIDTLLRNSSGPTNLGPQDSSMASFDFSGTVEISVTFHNEDIHSVRIRPLSYGITPVVAGRTITFSLSQPRNLSVEGNGDIFHNLQLFAAAIETTRPDASGPNVLYYGPGFHQVGRVTVSSGQTVYLAGGAVVEGSFLINHAENIRILGRGILSQLNSPPPVRGPRPPGAPPQPAPDAARSPQPSNRRDAITVEFSRNVEVEGIIVAPTRYTVLIGQSSNVAVRNIKSISAGGNNDGIDVFSSSNVTIDGVFLRNSDDNIAIYGHRWNYYGDTARVTVQNSVLWADVAHPILVGTHGDSTNPDTLEDLQFRNIDILEHREPQLDYQGCMSLNAGDSNLIRNVRFENIRVEDFGEGQLVNLRVFYNRKYNSSPGRGIENVLFQDISYTGTHANPSVIAGYDDARKIHHVVFENLRINGRLISDDMPGKPAYYKTGDLARIFVGEHVEDIVFQTAAGRN